MCIANSAPTREEGTKSSDGSWTYDRQGQHIDADGNVRTQDEFDQAVIDRNPDAATRDASTAGMAKRAAAASASKSPDLTDKTLRDARNAEFARNRARRGRKSQFLVDTGWSDPVGPMTSAGANYGDVKPL